MPAMAFEYLEVRSCIYLDDDEVMSYTEEASFELACSGLSADGTIFSTGWALYGRYVDEAGQFLAMAIGDFSEKDDAFKVMNAILAPMAQARDELLDAARNFDLDDVGKRRACLTAIQDVTNDLTDFIAQSSDHERL